MPELTLSHYAAGDTLAHRLDSRTKLLYVVWVFLMTAVVYDPRLQSVMVLTLVIAMLAGSIGPRRMMRAGRMAMIVAAVSFVLWLVFRRDEGTVLMGIFGFPITSAGVSSGVSVAIRITCVLFAFLVLSMTTSTRSIIAGLARLHVPMVFSMVVGMILRLVPQFQAEHAVIIEAQRARGIDFASGGPISRMRKHSTYVIPLVIRALKIVRDMSIAMDLRAYDPYRPRTWQPTMRLRWPDIAILVSLGLLLVAAVIARFFGYGGLA
jgi:energy-coupling factor transport system permease protein